MLLPGRKVSLGYGDRRRSQRTIHFMTNIAPFYDRQISLYDLRISLYDRTHRRRAPLAAALQSLLNEHSFSII